MRLIIYSLFENLLGRILFTAFWLAVTFPLVSLTFRQFAGHTLEGRLIWIFGLAIIMGGFILLVSQKIYRPFLSKLFLLGGLFATAFVLTNFSGFSTMISRGFFFSAYLWGLFCMTFYLILAFRYEKLVTGQIEFMADFSLASVLMLALLFFKEMFKIPMNHYQVLCFFTAGVALGIYCKFSGIRDGTEKKRHSWFIVTCTILIFIIVFAVILTFGFSFETLELLFYPLHHLFELVQKVFLLFLLCIITILAPALQWLIDLIRSKIGPEKMQQGQEGLQGLTEQLGELVNRAPAEDYSWIIRTFLIMVGLGIVSYIVIKYNRSKVSDTGDEELRESVFNIKEMEEDFRNLLKSITDRFRRKKSVDVNIYDGSSYVLKIRELYFRFINTLNPLVPFRNYTPREYLTQVIKATSVDPARTLTTTYEKARYSDEADLMAYTLMEEAYGKFKAQMKEEDSLKK